MTLGLVIAAILLTARGLRRRPRAPLAATRTALVRSRARASRVTPAQRTIAILTALAVIGGTVVLWRYLRTYPLELGDGASDSPAASAAMRLSLHLWMLGAGAIVAALAGARLFRRGEKPLLAAVYGASLGLGTVFVMPVLMVIVIFLVIIAFYS